MKKFGMLLVLLSLVTFNFGCNKPAADDGGAAPADDAAAPADDAGDAGDDAEDDAASE